jgi:putative ABC transport system permease protein
MFRNYLVTALRNIVRHKLYSAINIAGLAVGLACAVFIILFIRDEISYDKWVPDSENLYRVEVTFTLAAQTPMPVSGSPYPVAVAMQQQIPEVAGITHLTGQRLTVMIGNRPFLDQFYVSSSCRWWKAMLRLSSPRPIPWCYRRPGRANISATPNRWAKLSR